MGDAFTHNRRESDDEITQQIQYSEDTLKRATPVSLRIFPSVGESVRCVDGSIYHMEEGRVVVRKNGKYGVVFDWDESERIHYFWPQHLERFK